MLNRILIDSQAFTAKQETLQGNVSLNQLDERIWTHDFTDLSSSLAYTPVAFACVSIRRA